MSKILTFFKKKKENLNPISGNVAYMKHIKNCHKCQKLGNLNKFLKRILIYCHQKIRIFALP